jgi:hypothetical protein
MLGTRDRSALFGAITGRVHRNRFRPCTV